MKIIKLTQKEIDHLKASMKSNILLGFDKGVAENILDKLEEQLLLCGVVKSLPTLEEANIELKDFVETYYTEKETKARLECAIGFKHCYRWLSKILT